jgi:hypothetical protein
MNCLRGDYPRLGERQVAIDRKEYMVDEWMLNLTLRKVYSPSCDCSDTRRQLCKLSFSCSPPPTGSSAGKCCVDSINMCPPRNQVLDPRP